jgi:hypothetical protein
VVKSRLSAEALEVLTIDTNIDPTPAARELGIDLAGSTA